MSSWSELLDRAAPEEHVVQLYGSDDQLLTRNVSRYLAEGLKRGDGLVVIATREHADAVTLQLVAANADAVSASRDGRLVMLDAQQTLDRFLVDGQPDQYLFRSIVGGVLQEVRRRSSTGRIRAFGEMVGLLWLAGERAAAARLEEYWNELLVGSTCSLFCAYPIDIFDGGAPVSGLDAILCAHTHMYAGPKTMISSPRRLR
jgi:KaiC/GvpD/RAD55 family RecA-like ATPase